MTIGELAILVLLALCPFGLGLFIFWPALVARRRRKKRLSRGNSERRAKRGLRRAERERALRESTTSPCNARPEHDRILLKDPSLGGGRMAMTTYLILRAKQQSAPARDPGALRP